MIRFLYLDPTLSWVTYSYDDAEFNMCKSKGHAYMFYIFVMEIKIYKDIIKY